jgi:serine/threonine-protein kinase
MTLVRQTPRGLFSPTTAGLVAVVLIGVTLYVAWLVRERFRASVQNSLRTVHTANLSALELWLDNQISDAVRVAEEPAIESFAAGLVTNIELDNQAFDVDASTPTPRKNPAAQRIDLLTSQLHETGYAGWAILDTLGNILASSDKTLRGGQFPIRRAVFDRLSRGESTLIRPFQFQNSQGEGRVLMCALAPIPLDHRGTASIALMIDPADQFTEILSVAQIGSSGETYAFDGNGVMLSRSRFEHQLKSSGLLSADQSSPLHVQIRDPGVDLRKQQPNSDMQSRPLTKMADRATRGGEGFDATGYTGYRGVPVIGVWKWLPQYEFGVATELTVEEAYAPLRILSNSFVSLLLVVLISSISLLGFAWVARPRQINSMRLQALRRRLGQYDLLQPIGRGGMGIVYLGSHELLDRRVAIKVLENADANVRSLARFQREVQLTAKLQHPNTIEIYDFGRTEEGTFFYVMELVDGISLEQLIHFYGRQPAERVIYILLQICGSVSEAHSSGLVHRDIKPANVLLTSRSGIHDLVKVLDFGLAKQMDHDSLQLTRVDSLTGTPLFMSPESIRDASAAGVSGDVYSIGAVGYTLLCGRPPFEADCSADVCAMKLHQHPELPEDHLQGVSLAKDLQTILMSCLRLDPAERPESVEVLAARLAACHDSPRWTQADAALWWREVFDGPFPTEFEVTEDEPSATNGTRGDTAVNEHRPPRKPIAQTTAS